MSGGGFRVSVNWGYYWYRPWRWRSAFQSRRIAQIILEAQADEIARRVARQFVHQTFYGESYLRMSWEPRRVA